MNPKIMDIKKDLEALYHEMPFSLGLHTTTQKNAKQICEEGLLCGARALEGTVKLRGDLLEMPDTDLDYFFPYTDHTVVVVIPKKFDAPRIEDNEGGYKPLCEFSRFFEQAQSVLPRYSEGIEGRLPSYYILGYYDKDFRFNFNPNCMLLNQDAKRDYEEDMRCFESDLIRNKISIFAEINKK